jgi:hypothetical protein
MTDGTAQGPFPERHPVGSLINITERRASIENAASQKMLPKTGNLFELHLYNRI